MQLIRNEIRTGILVLLTLGLTVALVIYLSAPGLIRPVRIYHVYFDDAAAMKVGGTVLLAGRKIGVVRRIYSPVPRSDRPPGKPNYEARIDVEVSADAEIYRKNTVNMRTFGLLAELVIDFVEGDPESGRAENGQEFVGTRYPDISEIGPMLLTRIDPMLEQVSSTLTELKRTSQSLTDLTGKTSGMITNLNSTLQTFQDVGTNFKTLTQKNGSIETTLEGIRQTLRNVDQVTGQVNRENHLGSTLANLDTSAQRLKQVLGQLQNSFDTALPNLNTMLANLSEVSGRIRTQPWRLIWPSTIHYDETARSDNARPPRRPRGVTTEVGSQLGRKGVGSP